MQATPTPTPTKKRPGRPPTRPVGERTPLERWIDGSGLTREEVRARLGWPSSTFYDVLGGRITPSLSHAVQVEDLTGGAVPPRALLLPDDK